MDKVLDTRCIRSQTLTNAHALSKLLEEKGLPTTRKTWTLCVELGRLQAEANPACSVGLDAEAAGIALLETMVAELAAKKAK